ncbi:hypothetical protein BH18ACI1_BH18ACI1_20340 [soil metagenome]
MELTIHQQASENYNSKIEELITKLTSEHPLIEKMNEPVSSNPDVHTSFHFNETNIIGEIKFGWTDNAGKVSSRAFDNGEKVVGLFDNDYKNLIRIAEAFQKSIIPKGTVSIELLESLLFDWIKLKSRNEIELSTTEFILSECEKQIKECEVWIPISLLYIEAPFVLGKITFRAITKSMIDDWETHTSSKAKEKEVEAIKVYFERIRKDIQGVATATIKVEAEPMRAYQIAFEETERAMSVLRLFSPVNFSPTKICYSAPWGKQHQDKDRYLLVQDKRIVCHKLGFSDKTKPYWNLSNEDLDRYIAAGLDVLNFLLTKENLTDFQKKYLEAITIYSRSSLTKNLSDRLIYIIVALETIFLKDTGEHIQEAVSLRMAYMQPVSIEERKAIRTNVRKIYGLRSSFIHHGQYISVDNMAVIDEFASNACLSLLALTEYAVSDMTLENFFEFLENRKLSG